MLKQKLKTICCLLLAVVVGGGVFIGCNPQADDVVPDNMTGLYVNTFFAGLGQRWLEEYAREFEEAYKDYEFEPGKKGVKVVIDTSTSRGYNAVVSIANTRAEVIWQEDLDYYQLVSNGYALDISDIFDKPLTEYGETRSIKDKLDDAFVDYIYSYDGKPYAVPFYDGYKGIIYDVDLFEEKGLYLAEGFTLDNPLFTTGKEGDLPKGKGPDGQPRTFDDGLPQTYDQFFTMMDYMVLQNIVPFVWSGQYTYADNLTKGLWVNFEGKDQFELNFNYNTGRAATDLVNVAADGTITPYNNGEPVTITPENAYLLFRQEGRIHALNFVKELAKNNKYYYRSAFSTTFSHVAAKEAFLYGRAVSSKETIAMLVDGAWWTEEASGIFESMESEFVDGEKYSRENRRFAFMPFPHYDESRIGRRNTVLSANSSFAFINSRIAPEKVGVAKKFIEFTSTDRMIQHFNATIGINRAMNCELTDEYRDKLSPFGLSLFETRANSDIVYPFSGDASWARSGFGDADMAFANATIDGKVFNYPIYTFRDNPDITPAEYFNAVVTDREQNWPADL